MLQRLADAGLVKGKPSAWLRTSTGATPLLIHTAGFNLGLVMRQLIGVGTPRGLQGRRIADRRAIGAAPRALAPGRSSCAVRTRHEFTCGVKDDVDCS
jgi:hypothetical protein